MVNILESLENLLSEVRLKLIIILTFDMDDKLKIIWSSWFSGSLDWTDVDSSLHLSFFEIIQIRISQKQGSFLLQTESIELHYYTWEYNFLSFTGIHLCQYFFILTTTHIIWEFSIEIWFHLYFFILNQFFNLIISIF
jgi:hypothetical protein